jgi:predicted phage tail protein
MRRVKVFLHGYLRQFLNQEDYIEVEAETPAKAIEHITRVLPGFHPRLKEGPHRIAVVGHREPETLFAPLIVDTLHIVPQFMGGKSGGYIQIAIGAALVAAGISLYFIPGGQAFAAAVSPYLFSLGGALILGGLQQLLSPTPSSDDKEKKSRYLGAPKNTVDIGTRIPILYGEHQVYGHFLSFDISALNKSVTA